MKAYLLYGKIRRTARSASRETRYTIAWLLTVIGWWAIGKGNRIYSRNK